jgi:hypothetical protein
MEDKSKLMFVVLTFCGVACILGSLGAAAYLYHEHANLFIVPHEGPGLDNFAMFLVSVGVPSFATFVAGVVLTAIGIRAGLKDRAP